MPNEDLTNLQRRLEEASARIEALEYVINKKLGSSSISIGPLSISGKALRATGNNLFFGSDSGASITTGTDNTLLGQNAGASLTTGVDNVFLGKGAGRYATTTQRSVLVGNGAGGGAVLVGANNTCIGLSAGAQLTTGNLNIFIGHQTADNCNTGIYNVVVGTGSADTLTSGSYNVFLGSSAGQNITTGSNNLFLGESAGFYQTGSNKIIIDTIQRANEADEQAKSLIYGVTASATADQKLTINGLLNQSVSKTPASASAAGTAGDIAWDASYIYVCTATNTWKRTALSSW